MATVHNVFPTLETVRTVAYVDRNYATSGPAWLVTVPIPGLKNGYHAEDSTTIPQARAVVDDFGQLTLVSGWH
jgi:hypothetical protein